MQRKGEARLNKHRLHKLNRRRRSINRRKQRFPPQERDKQEATHCYYCDEIHPYGSHTRSRVESRKRELNNPSSSHNFSNTNQKNYMQAASTCRRCQGEVKGSQQTCGACGQIGKVGDRLHL